MVKTKHIRVKVTLIQRLREKYDGLNSDINLRGKDLPDSKYVQWAIQNELGDDVIIKLDKEIKNG